LLWLNSLFLLWLAFIPFPTALMGDFPGERIAVIGYGTVTTLAGVSFTFMRYYAFYLANLVDETIDRSAEIRDVEKRAESDSSCYRRIAGFRRHKAFNCSLCHSPLDVLYSKQARKRCKLKADWTPSVMAIHHFQPTHYHTTIGSHEPVLRVGNGDTVITTTVDAMGKDANEVQVTSEGNPQTGPFYVTDAEPGDTLVVRLDRIMPSRAIGYTGSVVAVNVVDPSYVSELPERELAEWRVDNERGTATLIKPETKLGNLTIPLAPMLGCFGVAPPGGQAISTATSADHGGNMDYRGFVAGVTVYLPVFVPGALLHVGDGHGTQGDGEIVGTGIEISMEVQFTVQVIKGKRIRWPRGENAEYIFAVGNARPLDQATQHATTEMLRWLKEDYGLNAKSASLLLGQCVEYDLGNVFDPAYTMVCKVRKALLRFS
jgi:amidase